MPLFKIGTLADWFGVGLMEGIKASRLVGAEGVQLYAAGELDPQKLSSSDAAAVKRQAAENGQQIAALCGELGGHGLCKREDNPAKLDYLKKTVELACRLDCTVVTTHIGVIPADENSPVYQTLLCACGEIGGFAQSRGACLAIETGPEPTERLAAFIAKCGGGVAVNYDPANLVMVQCEDAAAGVYRCGRYIVHTHAKDGLNLRPTSGEAHYGAFAEGGLEAMRALGDTRQCPLGEGGVEWKSYLAALKAVGYRGFLTIEREVSGNTTRDDIAAGVAFLKRMTEGLE